MSTLVIVGSQWGDEGKGKMVDIVSEGADVVARYQGGNNAGHTVVIGDTQYILHLVPSGALHPKCQCLIGNGLVTQLATNIERNACHGSDAPETAATEIAYFFPGIDMPG